VAVFMVVVCPDLLARVLTFQHEGAWLLPRFDFAVQADVARVGEDLLRSLGVVVEERFHVVAELHLPEEDSCSAFYNPNGAVRLTLLEATLGLFLSCPLPAQAQWTSAGAVLDSVQGLQDEFFHSYVVPAAVVTRKLFADAANADVVDPWRAHQWVHSASRYLLSVVRSCGAIPLSVCTVLPSSPCGSFSEQTLHRPTCETLRPVSKMCLKIKQMGPSRSLINVFDPIYGFLSNQKKKTPA